MDNEAGLEHGDPVAGGRVGHAAVRLTAIAGAKLTRRHRAPNPEVLEPPRGLLDQRNVDSFTLQPVVVLQPLGADERRAALAVLGDQLLRGAAGGATADCPVLGADTDLGIEDFHDGACRAAGGGTSV